MEFKLLFPFHVDLIYVHAGVISVSYTKCCTCIVWEHPLCLCIAPQTGLLNTATTSFTSSSPHLPSLPLPLSLVPSLYHSTLSLHVVCLFLALLSFMPALLSASLSPSVHVCMCKLCASVCSCICVYLYILCVCVCVCVLLCSRAC